MSSTIDILTPIHKGLRAMIYEVSARLQSTDFTDPVASREAIQKLKYEFSIGSATSCILCLLHEHAGNEEAIAFPEVERFDPNLIAQLLHQHAEILRRLAELSKSGEELLGLSDPASRVAAGERLNRQANQLFVFYLDHMNGEELTLVPLMQARLTDEEILSMVSRVERSMTLERYGEYMRWMLPQLNTSELVDLLHGAREEELPERARLLATIGDTHVDPTRWRAAQERAGL
jgi:Hemerythrin HHE cation binding domain